MTLLKNKIEILERTFFKDFPEEELSALRGAIDEIKKAGIEKGAVKEGERIPPFSLVDAAGRVYDSSEMLSSGPVVLSFYRGHWCPYCNLELRAYDDYFSKIEEKGAGIFAVSPQTREHTLKTAQMNDVEYPLLIDEGNAVAGSFGLVFRLPEEMISVYRKHGMVLPDFNGDDSWELPVPATYVVDGQGIVRGCFIDPDYSRRAEPSDILDMLSAL